MIDFTNAKLYSVKEEGGRTVVLRKEGYRCFVSVHGKTARFKRKNCSEYCVNGYVVLVLILFPKLSPRG